MSLINALPAWFRQRLQHQLHRRREELQWRAEQAARTKGQPDREYVTRLWAEDWDGEQDRTADLLDTAHRCRPGYACYDHQERRS
jgi:hypothetical protein